MLATNQLMTVIGVAFLIAASVIWLAPKPSRVVEPGTGDIDRSRRSPDAPNGTMFKKILVPTDGSSLSQEVTRAIFRQRGRRARHLLLRRETVSACTRLDAIFDPHTPTRFTKRNDRRRNMAS